MGLKIFPEFDSIYLLKKGIPDSWGIASTTESKIEIRCFITESESSSTVESIGGKMIVPTYNITFNGDVDIHVGDYIEVDGVKKIVLTRIQKKDLSRVPLITKITV